MVSGVTVVFWVSTVAWGFQSGNQAPAALLLSPVNATWAANNTSYWRDKGFSGFLLTGVSPGQGLSSDDVTDAAAAEDSGMPLIREVRLAVSRLVESGIDRNFLYWKFGPEDGFFSADGKSAANSLRRLSSFSAAMGLKGVAIDCTSSSGFYDYRWDGYSYEAYTAGDLENRARRTGRSLARSVLLEMPGAELLVITDGWPVSGALWLPFFEGVLEGCAMDDACRVCLLTRESFTSRSAMELRHVARETRATLERRLTSTALAQWQRKGSLGVGLSPLALDAERQLPVAAVDADAFRALVAAAKAVSDNYIWVESERSSWWRLTDQEVATYSQLLQNGPAVAEQTTPVVQNLDAYTLRMPYDAWRRVGPLSHLPAPGELYANDAGAALVLWAGAPEGLALPTDAAALTIQNLITGEPVDGEPNEGALQIPATASPLLIQGLPARPWIFEAGLDVTVSQPPTPLNPSAQIACRFTNAGGAPLAGSVDFLAPAGVSVNPRNLPFQLADGELVDATVNVRGQFDLAEPVTLTISLAIGGGGIVTRSLNLEACPDTRWAYALDADALGNLIAADVDGSPPPELLVCTSAGEAVCLNSDGGQVWKRRFSSTFAQKPAVGLLPSGAAAIAIIDTLGRIRMISSAGEISWEYEAGPNCHAPFFADVDEFEGQELVLPYSDGRIRALDAGGSEVWSYRPLLGLQHLQPAPVDNGKSLLLAVQNQPMGLLAGLGPSGRVRWSAALRQGNAGYPIIVDSAAGPAAVTATQDGAVTVHRLAGGEVVAQSETRIAEVRGIQSGGPGILLISQQGLHAYTPALEQVWSYDARVAGQPAATSSLIAVPAQGENGQTRLVALDGKGRPVWRSCSGPSATGSPVIVDDEPKDSLLTIYSSTDRTLTCLSFQPGRRAPLQ